ncbi:MAG: hypothetical protein K8S14_07615, partial [Actinomycetia bacterium]|nr:hypothetical protein [Actinomycetes bacterium]
LIAGGTGLMADFGEGNDTYRAEVFGQGCSYFYSLGMLYDQGGQDTYVAAQYSQGSGIHLASGCLWDGDGDDSYFQEMGLHREAPTIFPPVSFWTAAVTTGTAPMGGNPFP